MDFILRLILFMSMTHASMITGVVRNVETNKVIPNANLIIVETGQGTSTDSNGNFEIILANGTYTLETTVIGYKIDSKKLYKSNKPY